MKLLIRSALSHPAGQGDRTSFSFDGRAFYCSSNRPGSYGSGDLYVTTRDKLRQ